MSTTEQAHPSLTALIEKRDQLNQAIQAVQGLLGIGNGADFIESAIQAIIAKSLGTIGAKSSDVGNEDDNNSDYSQTTIRSDQFFGMSVMDASIAYLAIMKKPQSAQEIIDAIKSGGYLFQTSNPMASVTSTLNRSHGSNGPIVRTGKNMFALAEWYAGRPRNKKKISSRDQSDDGDSASNVDADQDEQSDDNGDPLFN